MKKKKIGLNALDFKEREEKFVVTEKRRYTELLPRGSQGSPNLTLKLCQD